MKQHVVFLCLRLCRVFAETRFAFSADFSSGPIDGSPNLVGGPWIDIGTAGEQLEFTSGVLDTSYQSSATALAADFVCTFGPGDTLTLNFDTVVPNSGTHGDRSSWAGILLSGNAFGASIPRVFLGNAPLTACLTVTGAGGTGCDVSSECCPSYGGVENTTAGNDASVEFSYTISSGNYQLMVNESGNSFTTSGTIASAAGNVINRLQVTSESGEAGTVADIALASIRVTGCGVTTTTTTTTSVLLYAFLADFNRDGPIVGSPNLVGSAWINTGSSDAQPIELAGGVLDTSSQHSATSLAADFVCAFGAGDTLVLSFTTVIPKSGTYGERPSWAGLLLSGTAFGAQIPRVFIGNAPMTSCLTVSAAGATGCNVASACCLSYGGVENTTAGTNASVELSYTISSGAYEVTVSESGLLYTSSGSISSAAGHAIERLQIVSDADSGVVSDIALDSLQVTGCGEVVTTTTVSTTSLTATSTTSFTATSTTITNSNTSTTFTTTGSNTTTTTATALTTSSTSTWSTTYTTFWSTTATTTGWIQSTTTTTGEISSSTTAACKKRNSDGTCDEDARAQLSFINGLVLCVLLAIQL